VTDTILEVRDLKVWFPIKTGVFARTTGQVKAVDGVTFAVRRGETLGIVGESGSGKSTIARAITGLVKPTAGRLELAEDERVAMVFQDPLGSLNPRQTVRAALEEAIRCACGEQHRNGRGRPCPQERRAAIDQSTNDLLALVGLDASVLDKYPHEFSGGQRQRICIARAIATNPKLLICDEAVSALDLSIRARVLDLLADLKARLELTLVFITHDLGVVRHVADRVLVMHRGRIVEEGPCAEVLSHPKEAYTRELIAAVPRIG